MENNVSFNEVLRVRFANQIAWIPQIHAFWFTKFTLKIIMSAIPRKDPHIELDHENIKLDLTAHLQMLSWWKDNKNNNTSNYNLTKKTRWI